MSKLRPEASTTSDPAIPNATAYYAIYGAVQGQDGLCHGKLHDGMGHHCAIGSLWSTSRVTLQNSLIDEVAAVNDAVPYLSYRQRKQHVLRWLRWKLGTVGMPLSGPKARLPVKVKR